MATFPPGTNIPGPFTSEQRATLTTLVDATFSSRIMPAAYADQLLLPDGTFSADLVPMRVSFRQQINASLLAGTLQDLRDAIRLAHKMEEAHTHVQQHRFLFVVDVDAMPIVYFQCATIGNPDKPPLR